MRASNCLHGQIQKFLSYEFCPEVFCPTLTLVKEESIKIPLKVGHKWPCSGTPFKWHFPGGGCCLNIECFLDPN